MLGHRYRFYAQGATMFWRCDRGCDAGGQKRYATPAEARRYAAAFDREDVEQLGRRAPVLGMFPLRVYRYFRDRR